jgi:hypothetical protein
MFPPVWSLNDRFVWVTLGPCRSPDFHTAEWRALIFIILTFLVIVTFFPAPIAGET